MGICRFFKVLVVSFVVFLLLGVSAVHCATTIKSGPSICDTPGCNCTSSVSPSWKTINCTFNNTQKIELRPESIPDRVSEFFITGGHELDISPQTFQSKPGLTMVGVDGVRNVFLKKQSFHNITSPVLRVQIQNCDRIIIETGALKNILSSIFEVYKTEHVIIRQLAFSRLQEGKFKDIKILELAEESFLFEQSHMGRHGPVTVLHFDNVIIPKIPKGTFSSALAEISIFNSEIRDIQKEAFKALQISVVALAHTTIHRLRMGAFNEGTLIFNFIVTKCNISILEARAITAAITNLTIQHSRLTDIYTGAITSTVANAVICDNEVARFHTAAFVFSNWNKINIDNNIIKDLHSGFLEASSSDITEFTFVGNEIYKAYPGALDFAPQLDRRMLNFDNNFFNHTCHCDMEAWLQTLLNNSDIWFVMNTSFCTVNDILARCFELKEGLINMANFTELVCIDSMVIKCEPYSGETKILDTTSKVLLIDEQDENSNSWILIVVIGALLIIALSGTILILIIRGGLWLKRKGYFQNSHYNHNEEVSNDDENTIVTVDRNDKFELPDELTPELLQTLREQLEDPLTHNEAREMIEKLYDMFIVDESYTNNNRQEEEAHLYEELGNLQQPQTQEHNVPKTYLRVMERKINNLQINDTRPALAVDYSEPSDAAVHLYSELKQSKPENDEKKDSLKSTTSSGKMAFRPLPDKPKETEAGPSSKY